MSHCGFQDFHAAHEHEGKICNGGPMGRFVPALPGYIYARVNWSRWIGDCPSPWCQSALMMPPGQRWMRCMDCGASGEVIWPGFVEEIERLLLMRPDPMNRNWEPYETLHDLLSQNMEHGLLIPPPELRRHGPVMSIIGDKIVIDNLPLPAGVHRQIEG